MRVAGAIVLSIGVILFGSLWIEHHTDVALPAPTGPFAVGRAIFDWRDSAHEVQAWVWFPAEGGVPDDYAPAALKRPRGRGLFALLTRDPSRVHCHSRRDARVSPGSHPVLIMRSGGSAPVMNYSALAEDLASHGYVVVGFDAPYRTSVVAFPDGRVILRSSENNPETGADIGKLLAAWIADIGFVLDMLEQHPPEMFAGRLDLSRAGVFGHSFGGAQALQFCRDDSRCKAGVDIDGMPLGDVARTGVGKPFMFVLSDHRGEADSARVMADIESIYNRLPPDQRGFVSIPGANHFTFSDDGALLKSWVFRAAVRVFHPRRQLALTVQYLRTFFDAHLRGATAG